MHKFLIVGLGNVGEKYLETRHNIGFLVADALAKELSAPFSPNHFGMLSQTKYKGRPVFLLKPNTYMNLSGKAVKFWMQKENIPLEKTLVILDDLHIPFGSLRFKTKGSDGGHNGLKSIQEELQNSKYPRLRLGIGKDFAPGEQIDYVLGKWSEAEKEKLDALVEKAKNAILSFIFHGASETMNRFNQ